MNGNVFEAQLTKAAIINKRVELQINRKNLTDGSAYIKQKIGKV